MRYIAISLVKVRVQRELLVRGWMGLSGGVLYLRHLQTCHQARSVFPRRLTCRVNKYLIRLVAPISWWVWGEKNLQSLPFFPSFFSLQKHLQACGRRGLSMATASRECQRRTGRVYIWASSSAVESGMFTPKEVIWDEKCQGFREGTSRGVVWPRNGGKITGRDSHCKKRENEWEEKEWETALIKAWLKKNNQSYWYISRKIACGASLVLAKSLA